MGKIEVAFCEEDDIYRNRFVEYLVEHRADEMSIHAFSAVKPFVEAAEQIKFDVILLGNGFIRLAEILWERKFPVLLLKDSMPQKVAEDISYQNANDLGQRSIFRFQSMEAITHEIFAISQGADSNKKSYEGVSGIELIGVYSPVRCEMQIPFSVVLAQSMSDNRKVMYLNLMENGGFMELFGRDARYDLGDVIVRLRGEKLTQEFFYQSVYEMEHFCYIPPFQNPENLYEFSFSDFTALIRFIREQTDVEVIIIDFGEGLEHFSGMLELCSSIYGLVKGGYICECQTKHFLEYIDKNVQKNLKAHLKIIDIPYSAKSIRGGKDVLRQLLYSDFGDYVRKCSWS